MSLILAFFIIFTGKRVRSFQERFSRLIWVEGDELRFRKPLKLTPGYFQVEYGSSSSQYPSFYSTGNPVKLERVRPEAWEEISIISGWSWMTYNVARIPKAVVRLPAYRVDEEEFKTFRGYLMLGILPALRHEVLER